MFCGLAAMLQASGTDGAAFRRRTSTQGETRGGLTLLHRPQVCVFRLTRCRCFNHSSPCPRLSASRYVTSSSGGILLETYRHASSSIALPSRDTNSIQKEGRCATLIGFAARAGAEANHALTFKPDHSLGADQIQPVIYWIKTIARDISVDT